MMAKPDGNRVRVPKSEHLLLRALAVLKSKDCSQTLIDLIRAEAEKRGVTPEAVARILGGRKRPVSEMAQALRNERIKRGVTQTELGQVLGISTGYVAAVENGIKPLPVRLVSAVKEWLNPPREDLLE